MSISVKDVSELRKATGAGMMDCKQALKESDGDFEGALDYLRKKVRRWPPSVRIVTLMRVSLLRC